MKALTRAATFLRFFLTLLRRSPSSPLSPESRASLAIVAPPSSSRSHRCHTHASTRLRSVLIYTEATGHTEVWSGSTGPEERSRYQGALESIQSLHVLRPSQPEIFSSKVYLCLRPVVLQNASQSHPRLRLGRRFSSGLIVSRRPASRCGWANLAVRSPSESLSPARDRYAARRPHDASNARIIGTLSLSNALYHTP